MRVIAIVGMPGSGKTDALGTIEKLGIHTFNMGDVVTKIEPAKRGIKQINEDIEHEIRTDIRKQLGPAAVAIVTSEAIEKMAEDTVAIAGLHSFAELDYFKERFGQDFILISIEADRNKRADWSAKRKARPLSKQDFEQRDSRYKKDFQIPEIMEKADYKIDNNSSIEEFRENIKKIIKEILNR